MDFGLPLLALFGWLTFLVQTFIRQKLLKFTVKVLQLHDAEVTVAAVVFVTVVQLLIIGVVYGGLANFCNKTY